MPDHDTADSNVALIINGDERVGDQYPLPVTQVGAGGSSSPSAGALTDRSGEITSGGASQQVMAANEDRRYLLIVNISSETLWVNFGSAAVAARPSIPLVTYGDSLVMEGSFVSNQAVNIIGATTGSDYAAKEG